MDHTASGARKKFYVVRHSKDTETMPERIRDLLVGITVFAIIIGSSTLVLTLIYGIVVIVFRSAFGVELWNPFR